MDQDKKDIISHFLHIILFIMTAFAAFNSGFTMHVARMQSAPTVTDSPVISSPQADPRNETAIAVSRANPKSRVKPKTCSSRFRGVSWHKKCGKWRAVAHVDGKPRHLGVFKREMDASVAYQAAKQSFYLN